MLIGPLHVVLDRVAAEGQDFQPTKQDIKAYEDTFGRNKNGSMVIMQTDHEELFGTSDYTNIRHPGFSGDAVLWLVDGALSFSAADRARNARSAAQKLRA